MVSNNFMEIRMGWGGGGSLNLEILGGGAQAVSEIQMEEGIKKPCLPLEGVWIFSGINH